MLGCVTGYFVVFILDIGVCLLLVRWREPIFGILF